MKKRLLSLVLAWAVCLTMLPAVALAADTSGDESTVGIYLRTLHNIESGTELIKLPADQLQTMRLVDYYNSDNYGNWIDYGSFTSDKTAGYNRQTQERNSEGVRNVVAEITSANVPKTSNNISFELPLNNNQALTWDTLSWSQNRGGDSSWHLNGELYICKVTLNPNYDDAASETRYAVYNTDVNSGLTTPTREGYVFDGWYTAKNDGDEITSIPELTSDVTYYAHWTEQTVQEHKHTVGDSEVTFNEWTLDDSLPDSAGSYYLTKDVKLNSTWTPTGDVNLCLNGFSIIGSTGDVIYVNAEKTLNLYDCKGDKSEYGKIVHPKGGVAGRGICVYGTLNMYGGDITGNALNSSDSTSGAGGGVQVFGTFNMYGGSITNNSATANGGGVDVHNNAYFNMYGGTISGNYSGNDGGGVNISSGITFTMTGGTITNNTAKGNGGGVNLYGNINISGTVNITNNFRKPSTNENTKTANNVYEDKNYSGGIMTISADKQLTDSNIGVTTAEPPADATPVPITNGGGQYYEQFTSDDDTYSIVNYNGHVALKTAKYQVQDPLTLDLSATTIALGDKLTLKTSGGSGNGEVTYSVTNGTGTAVLNGDVLTAQTAGTVQVKAHKAGDGTYLSAESPEVTITIIPVTQSATTGEPAYTPITEAGKTLADAKLSIGTISPAEGTLVWNDGDSTTVQANKAYRWTFTPADSNYANLTGEITPYKVSSSPSGGGSHSSGSSTTKYTVTVPSGTTGGTAKSSVASAASGSTVTITVTPANGYKVDKVSVADGKGNSIKVTDKGDNKYTFTMPSSKVTVTPTFSRIEETKPETTPFDDVAAEDYFYDAVKWAADKGITGGVSSSLFAPEDGCTRAQIVTFLWRAAGSPEPKQLSSFADISADAYYAKAVAWAVENGITVGTTATTFSPDDICTRAHGVTFLYRAAKATAPASASVFTDVAESAYYADAVKWATEQGITKGISSTLFGPDNTCTRAQIVTFLYRLYQGK